MKPRIKLGVATAPDGSRLELIQHDRDYMLTVDGMVLMSTRLRHSEEELARLAMPETPAAGAKVLIGGLGLGFTLRAALDLLPEDATAIQAELCPEVAEWNRGPVGESAGHPLDDPRTKLVLKDVGQVMRGFKGELDAIMLDVDNGPTPLVSERNSALYSDAGLFTAFKALKPGGRLAIWSADADKFFPEKMEAIGFESAVHKVRGSHGKGSPTHRIYVGVA